MPKPFVSSHLTNPPVLKPAALGRCFASLFYELLLLVAMLLAVSGLLTLVQALVGPMVFFIPLQNLAQLIALFAYFTYCWVHGGQTAAMKTWHLRLVNQYGGPVSWQQASMRFVVALILFVGLPLLSYQGWLRVYGPNPQSIIFALSWYAVPFLSRYYDKERCFLHDRLAGTRQIQLPKSARSATG
ncbi:RDD family protein [Neisseriaceae bacterium TC5R-5]|nr:RDD family protein [Neisseriaceae bacterium TC5R-5]